MIKESTAKNDYVSAKNITSLPNKKFVFARLLKARSYARGDFKILENDAIVNNIRITSANRYDKGNIPKEGELYYITGYPTDPDGNIMSDVIDGKPNYLDRHSTGMGASKLVDPKTEEIDEIKAPPPKPLGQAVKELGQILIRPSKAEHVTLTCQRAPTTLKEALHRLKAPNHRDTKIIPPTAPAEVKKDGRKVVSGAYIESKPGGGIAFSANNKGMLIDDDGNVAVNGDFAIDQVGPIRPTVAGLPSKQNELADFQPKTIIFPAGLGLLALDRLPDLSILNWTLKLIQGFKMVKQISSSIRDYKKAVKENGQTKASLTDKIEK